MDEVFPDVPVRRWVLSLPPRLRYELAWRHDVCHLAVFMQSVPRQLRARAVGGGREGSPRRCGGHPAVGGALNLNIQVHALVLDGVFAPAPGGGLRFHRAAPADLDVAEVLAAVEARVGRLLERRGLGDRDDAGGDAWEGTPVLGGLAAAAVHGDGRARRATRSARASDRRRHRMSRTTTARSPANIRALASR